MFAMPLLLLSQLLAPSLSCFVLLAAGQKGLHFGSAGDERDNDQQQQINAIHCRGSEYQEG
jgi:hypothetical protein